MKLCSNVCNRCHLACKILFKSEQICGCCCKMLRGSLILGHTVQPAVSTDFKWRRCQLLGKHILAQVHPNEYSNNVDQESEVTSFLYRVFK